MQPTTAVDSIVLQMIPQEAITFEATNIVDTILFTASIVDKTLIDICVRHNYNISKLLVLMLCSTKHNPVTSVHSSRWKKI